MSNGKLLTQWLRLLDLPSAPNRLTKDLYESMYTRGEFIAHFDRMGFYRSRFCTLMDFDQTLEMMAKVPELKELIKQTPVIALANARYKIASLEASILTTKARVMLAHVERLQSQFTRAIA